MSNFQRKSNQIGAFAKKTVLRSLTVVGKKPKTMPVLKLNFKDPQAEVRVSNHASHASHASHVSHHSHHSRHR
ncbi:hypothetical protein HH214_06070 [Mucilaginibacter robiniae]|uniref:Uncharacterized protein n=1 Tax=Mucilaginibacter robiniae TaxID=2728022 RepID=A0A7L5DWJ6_9SPHI|nr:hypothetical protein [Mucilaginibacter robiniae]QJD95470.1 hypothetical protein HH214_06070 [Mucilaginibacter robiniae]